MIGYILDQYGNVGFYYRSYVDARLAYQWRYHEHTVEDSGSNVTLGVL